MRWIIFLFLIIFNNFLFAKEWKSLKHFQNTTQKQTLSASNWLKKDRLKNTITWQKANDYNLINNLSEEYTSIEQRSHFYYWLFSELDKKGHEVLWVKMAHFISKKMHLLEVFPYSMFSKKTIKIYANQGSETVFIMAFSRLKKLYLNQEVLTGNIALNWDKSILKEEQFNWINSVYITMDPKSLKTLERIAKGKFLYGLLVPKAIRFKNELFDDQSRYNYAVDVLKPYCKNRYKS